MRKTKSAFAVIWCLFGGSLAAGATPAQPAWLAFGDMRGYIEPCGCDPATDMGGVLRLAKLVSQERLHQPQLLLLSLGNNLPIQQDAIHAVATDFILQAMQRLKPAAELLGQTEYQAILKQPKSKVRRYPNYLVSNLKPESALKSATTELIRVGTTTVMGYAAFAGGDNDLVRLDPKLLDRWREMMAKAPASFKILLFSGPDSDLDELQKAQMFDLILSSNRAVLDKVVDNSEHLQPETLLRATSGLAIRMVPIGAQGVLRGGALEKQRPISMNEMLNVPAGCSRTSLLGSTSCQPATPATEASWLSISWLDKSYTIGSPLVDLMRRYNLAVAANYKTQEALRARTSASSQYVGAAACKGCHAASYRIWAESKHARAFATLVAKHKTKDAACVSCHVVAFAEAGGFVSLKNTPHLKDVQCESCHGPRKEHIANPAAHREAPGSSNAVCVTCHQGMHSPGFEFNKYWQQIVH